MHLWASNEQESKNNEQNLSFLYLWQKQFFQLDQMLLLCIIFLDNTLYTFIV